MRCYLCGKEIAGESINPYPLCGDDEGARCCTTCYTVKVLTARALLAKTDKPPINVGDRVVIMYSSKIVDEDGEEERTWLKGEVTDLRQENDVINYYGTWGNFPLNKQEDIYVKVDQ